MNNEASEVTIYTPRHGPRSMIPNELICSNDYDHSHLTKLESESCKVNRSNRLSPLPYHGLFVYVVGLNISGYQSSPLRLAAAIKQCCCQVVTARQSNHQNTLGSS